MSQNPLDSDHTAAKFTDVPQHPFWWHRLYPNSRAFFSSFLALIRDPGRFVPLIVDCCLLIQSIWSGRQPGPDIVYPMSSIRKKQSGRLARLILEHCRDVRQYELRAATPFSQGFEPPCVVMVDLDELPRDIVGNGYSTQVDLYGLTCLLMLFNVHVVYLFSRSGVTWINFADAIAFNLILCLYAVLCGDGTLTLARRSDTSTPGCVVLLDQDFTVILNGSQGVVEAIAESSFNLSHPNSMLRLRPGVEDHGLVSFYDLLVTNYLSLFPLLHSLSRSQTPLATMAQVAVGFIIGRLLPRFLLDHFTRFPVAWFKTNGFASSNIYSRLLFTTYVAAVIGIPFFQMDLYFLTAILIVFLLVGYRTRNYPIRSGKLLDALGHPRVRKWQFDTLAAAATFQCLVLCRGIARPIRNIDVFAFLDMLVPDQRDVQKAWKERVADRIVHEADICFAPTIPMFGDERQQQLKDLLDQAQLGDCMYRRFYV